jgi:hypothetical protein
MFKKYFTSFIKFNGLKKQTFNMKFTSKTDFKVPKQNKGPPVLNDQQKMDLEESLKSKESLEDTLFGQPGFESLSGYEKKMIAAEDKCKKKKS